MPDRLPRLYAQRIRSLVLTACASLLLLAGWPRAIGLVALLALLLREVLLDLRRVQYARRALWDLLVFDGLAYSGYEVRAPTQPDRSARAYQDSRYVSGRRTIQRGSSRVRSVLRVCEASCTVLSAEVKRPLF